MASEPHISEQKVAPFFFTPLISFGDGVAYSERVVTKPEDPSV